MRLKTIRLHPFGRFADESWNLEEPLVVVHGPNEQGKSTLRQAIVHALFTSTALTPTQLKKTVGPWVPLPAGDHAAVALTFEHGGATWTLEKRWGGGRSSRLSDGTTSFADPEAVQEQLALMLAHGEATFRHVLFTGQAELERTLDAIEAHAGELRDIGELLRAAAGGEADVDERRLRQRLEERIAAAFGRWNDQRGRPEPQNGQERGIANPWKNGVGEILAAWYGWQTLVAEHDDILRVEREIDRLSGEVARIEQSIAEAAGFLERFGGMRVGVTARGEWTERVKRLEGDEAAMQAAFQHWPQAEAAVDAWKRQRDELKVQLEPLEAELANARKRDGAAAARHTFKTIEAAKQKCEQAEAELGMHPDPGQERLEAIDRLEKAITAAQNTLAARTLAWRIEAEQGGTVVVERGGSASETVAVGPEPIAGTAEARVRVVAGGVTLTVESGGDDVAAVFESLARDQESLARELAACNAATADAVRVNAARHRDARTAAANRKTVYQGLLGPTTFEQWAAEIKAIDDLPHARDVAVIEGAIASARTKLAEGEARAATHEQSIEAWKKKYANHGEVGTQLLEVRSLLARARQELAALPALPEGYDSPAAFVGAIDRAQASQLAGQQQLTAKKAEAAELTGQLGDRRSEDVAERAEAEKRTFERARAQGRAYLRIREELERIMADREEDPLEGFGERVSEFFARITGGAVALEFDGQLPANVVRGAVSLSPERLSHGGGGALALAVRLAMAEAYLGSGGGFVMLDDPLVHFDAARMAIAADILREFSERAQVIFFTCHDHHAARLRPDSRIPSTGIETPPITPGDTAFSQEGGAESGAVDSQTSELVRLLTSLTPAQRDLLLGLVRGKD
jgi:DNA repair exonuclease SbcCD ATPase subunit